MTLLPETKRFSNPPLPLSKELSISCDGLKSHSKTCDDLPSRNSSKQRLKSYLPHWSSTSPLMTTSSTSLKTLLTKYLIHPFTPSALKSQNAKNSSIAYPNPFVCNRQYSYKKTKSIVSTQPHPHPHTARKSTTILLRLCPWTPRNAHNTLLSNTTTTWPRPPANFIHVHTVTYVHLDTPSLAAPSICAPHADNTVVMMMNALPTESLNNA